LICVLHIQYYTDNPWKRECEIVNMIGKFTNSHSHSTPLPTPHDHIPEWIFERSRSNGVQECVIARRALPDVAISKRELRSLRNLMSLREC
jgi:hypothetical protein